ncbi:hypothetical protein BASA81_012758 [Batrachochytrium salamandrivorans]|nr:hypothetical protein BASA81_012758 [Batrachochytrium salamandrivorans]
MLVVADEMPATEHEQNEPSSGYSTDNSLRLENPLPSPLQLQPSLSLQIATNVYTETDSDTTVSSVSTIIRSQTSMQPQSITADDTKDIDAAEASSQVGVQVAAVDNPPRALSLVMTSTAANSSDNNSDDNSDNSSDGSDNSSDGSRNSSRDGNATTIPAIMSIATNDTSPPSIATSSPTTLAFLSSSSDSSRSNTCGTYLGLETPEQHAFSDLDAAYLSSNTAVDKQSQLEFHPIHHSTPAMDELVLPRDDDNTTAVHQIYNDDEDDDPNAAIDKSLHRSPILGAYSQQNPHTSTDFTIAVHTALDSDSDSDLQHSSASSRSGARSRSDSVSDSLSDCSLEDGELRSSMIGSTYTSMPEPGTYVTVFDYIPQKPNELTVRLGDIIDVHLTFHDGWCLGENHQTRAAGMVPLYSLVKLAPELEIELLAKLPPISEIPKPAVDCVVSYDQLKVEVPLQRTLSTTNSETICSRFLSTSTLSPYPSTRKASTLFFVWRFPAEKVGISGTFNNWKRQIPMFYDHSSKMYTAFVEGDHLAHGDICEYKYFVDGIWTCDDELPVVVDGTGIKNNFLVVCTQFAYGRETTSEIPQVQYIEQQRIFPEPLDSEESWRTMLLSQVDTTNILVETARIAQSLQPCETYTGVGWRSARPTNDTLPEGALDHFVDISLRSLPSDRTTTRSHLATQNIMSIHDTVDETDESTAFNAQRQLPSEETSDWLSRHHSYVSDPTQPLRMAKSGMSHTSMHLSKKIDNCNINKRSSSAILSIEDYPAIAAQSPMHSPSQSPHVHSINSKTDSAVFISSSNSSNSSNNKACKLSPVISTELMAYSLLELDAAASRNFVHKVWGLSDLIPVKLDEPLLASHEEFLEDDVASIYYSDNECEDTISTDERQAFSKFSSEMECSEDDLDIVQSGDHLFDWVTINSWLSGGVVAFDGLPLLRVILLWMMYLQICYISWSVLSAITGTVTYILKPAVAVVVTLVSATVYMLDAESLEPRTVFWSSLYHLIVQAYLYLGFAFLILCIDHNWDTISTYFPFSLLALGGEPDSNVS